MNRIRRLISLAAVTVLLFGAVAQASTTPASAMGGGSSAPENLGGVTGQGFVSNDGTRLTGKGQMIVIIDGAFNPTHPMLAGRVVEEACFGTYAEPYDFAQTTCSRNATQWSADSRFRFEAGPGTSKYNLECVDGTGRVCHDFHGTAVAAMAAGSGLDVGYDVGVVGGVAPEADIALIKVGRYGGWNVTAVEGALQYVRDVLAPKYAIAAVNVSASLEEVPISDSAPCPTTSFSSLVSDLAARGIAVTLPAGNRGAVGATGMWACAPDGISVGVSGVTDMLSVAAYSDASARTKLLAPVGSPANASDPDGVWTAFPYVHPGVAVYENNYNKLYGASFSAPQVAGAFAIMRQKHPDWSVAQITESLQSTGVGVLEPRLGAQGRVYPRLWLAAAAGARDDKPVWAYQAAYRTSIPMVAANKTELVLFDVAPDGNIDESTQKIIAQGWDAHSLTIPVHDLYGAASNGFVTATGLDLYYHPFSGQSGKLGKSELIASGAAADLIGGAYASGLPLPGTGRGFVLQKSNGQIVLRVQEDANGVLSPEITNLIPADASTNSRLVGVADLNQDGRPDLVVRDATTGKSRVYFGTGDHTAPFATQSVAVTSESWWADKEQVFVVDGWASSPGKPATPWIGYRAPVTGAILLAPLESDGTLDSGNLRQSGNWVKGVRILFAGSPN